MIPAILPYPDIDPVLFSFSLGGLTIAIRWYALAYIASFLLAVWWINRALGRPALWPSETPPMTRKQTEDLLTWVIVGTILGGRIGYYLFYVLFNDPGAIVRDPMGVLRIWEGGMSYHGGALGVALAGVLYCRRYGLSVASVGDCFALAAPIGMALGRLANFINGELWGRPTDVPWSMVFPHAPPCPLWMEDPICARHPSQLYQAGLEGLVILVLLGWLAYRRGALKIPGQLVALYFLGHGVARVVAEGFRQGDAQFTSPDNPVGHILRFGTGPEAAGLTMGQLLSVPMILFGCLLLIWVRRRHTAGP